MSLGIKGFNCAKFFVPQRLLNLSAKCNIKQSVRNLAKPEKCSNKIRYDEFPLAFPDFLPSITLNRRNPLFEDLVHADMLERRLVLNIPEFYVGSILAVTTAEANLSSRKNRFVGICISRHRQGLHHQFILRNIVDGLGVEIMYEMYNPTILKIEILKLERRLDDDLTYLSDALPKYSTFDFNMEPIAHPQGSPVPINPIKVKLRPPPWRMRWSIFDLKGIEESWTLTTPWYKRKMGRFTKMKYFQKYDIVQHYRDNGCEYEREAKVQDQIELFETERQKAGATKRQILKLASKK